MIKENELRVNNYIYYCDEIYKVDRDCIYKHMGDEQDDAYQPIPLTEDILLKCGFIYDKISKVFYTKNVNDFNIKKDIENVKGFWLFFDEQPNHPLTVVFNLHELQNLYFALTGEELEVKL
jgi:hypothetical protein